MRKLLTVVFIFCNFAAHAVQIDLREGDRHFLIGTCSDITREAKQIAPASSPQCKCRENLCETEVTGLLPERISFTLKNSNLKGYGPNCWNSVLYTMGAAQGLHYVNDGMDYLLSTPLCKKTNTPPRAGDIVNIKIRDEETSEFFSEHTYRLLSDSIAYNKNSPVAADPYELVPAMLPLMSFEVPQNCRFVDDKTAKKNNCEMIAETFTCSGFEGILSPQNPKEVEALEKLTNLSDVASTRALTGVRTTLMLSEPKILLELARNALGLKSQVIPSLIRKRLTQYRADYSEDVSDQAIQDLFEAFYILSDLRLNTESYAKEDRAIVNLMRKHSMYFKGSIRESLFWSMVYKYATDLEEQLGEDYPL